jgi:hypothetical protein
MSIQLYPDATEEQRMMADAAIKIMEAQCPLPAVRERAEQHHPGGANGVSPLSTPEESLGRTLASCGGRWVARAASGCWPARTTVAGHCPATAWQTRQSSRPSAARGCSRGRSSRRSSPPGPCPAPAPAG